ncbi:MAG: hypothetical protein RL380_221 [Verrucomicrobiota bacterium]
MKMKTLFLACALALIAARSHAALLAYEPFTNAVGANIVGAGGGLGFNGVWGVISTGSASTNTGFSLNYTDSGGRTLVTDGGGSVHGAGYFQGLTSANTSAQPYRQFNFSRGTNGTDNTSTWISFMAIRLGATNGGANPWARGANLTHDFSTNDAASTTYAQKLAVGNGSGAATNVVSLLPTGSAAQTRQSTNLFTVTNFIVVKIDHVLNAADNAYLFVNPPLNAEPGIASALLATNSLNTYDYSFDRIRVFAGGQSSAAQPFAEWIVDEYRLGETYADVAPYTSGGGGPATNNSSWASVTVSANSPTLTLTGTNNATYTVLGSTNVAAAIGTWTTLGTVTLNGSGTGTFTDTNALNSNVRRFYRAKSP